MLKIQSEYATRCQVATFNSAPLFGAGTDSKGYSGYMSLTFTGPFRCVRSFRKKTVEDKVDVGWILTTPSDSLPDCNDCRHYDVDGSCERKVPDLGISYSNFGDFYCRATVTSDAGQVSTFDSVLCNDSMNRHIWTCDNGGLYGRDYYRAVYSDFDITVDETNQRFVITYHVKRYYKARSSSTSWTSRGEEQRTKIYAWNKVSSWSSGINFDISTYEPPTAMSIYYNLNPDDTFFDYVHWSLKQEGYTYGDLTADAADSVRISNANNLNNIKELMALGELAQGLTQIFSAGTFSSLKSVAKAVSGTYLAYHYGLRLTVKDADSLAHGLDKLDLDHSTQTVGSSRSVEIECPGHPGISIFVDQHFKGVIDNFSNEYKYFVDKVKQFTRGIFEFDLVPSMANLWDAIPFSFVLDWIFPIGDAFERSETRQYVKTLTWRKAFYSQKWNWSYGDAFTTESGYKYTCNLKFRYYTRTCSSTVAIPPLGSVDHQPKGLVKHWFEGTALFISYLK